jgi:hypothetical protein
MRPVDGLQPAFIDFRAGAPPEPLHAALAELDADVVLVFRPEIIPPGLFDGLRALTLGYLTEPLPRTSSNDHADLRARLGWLSEVDPGNFDRIVAFDPLIVETASSVLPVWRALPLPVEDGLFLDIRLRAVPPRLLFVGRSTSHREELLAPIKARHPIVHIGHGLFGETLDRFLRAADVQLNLHNNPYPTFENRVCIALASGHLVISEPLSPRNDLVPGKHYLEADGADVLAALVDEVMTHQAAYLDVQVAGRERAEAFRASRVYPRLLNDALADVAERGSTRRSG